MNEAPQSDSVRKGPLRSLWNLLGPGLVTGAADDDPSGIATYSQAGAQFGYGLSWSLLLTLPFMAAIQIVSAWIGWHTRAGLARNVRKALPAPVLYALVGLLVVANTINIAADLAAMGDALRLVVGGPSIVYALCFGVACLIAEVFIPYHVYAGYLKITTLVLLVYIGAALSVHIPWGTVLRSLVLPQVTLQRDVLLTIVAVFGTTISPYLFFWQASQEAEESRLSHRRHAGLPAPKVILRNISVDTWIGMAFSNVIGLVIMITAAATLNQHGVTQITSAAQAAEALRPIAGDLTFGLFAAGIIGTGLLAVPVLAGSAAYGVADTFGLRGSLELPARRALEFYAIVAAATLGGAAIAAANIDPISMLFWAAVINGVVAVPIMIVMMVMVSGDRGRRTFGLPRSLLRLGWLGAALMGATVAALAWSAVRP